MFLVQQKKNNRMNIHTYAYIYIYIEREREREKYYVYNIFTTNYKWQVDTICYY